MSAQPAKQSDHQPPPRLKEVKAPAPPPARGWKRYLKAIGPGFMAGLADNDPSGVASYAIAGASAGFGQLWLLVVATFMVQAVQVTSARLGDIAHAGVLALTERRYGRVVALLIALVGLVANEATLLADTAAIGASLQLLTGIGWRWFVFPAVLVLMLATVFFSFQKIRTFFLVIGLVLLSYVVTAFLAHPDWVLALKSTVVPVLPSGLNQLEAAVALLGTTISPYLIFWEAEGEKEEHRSRKQFVLAEIDVTGGFIASNVISYFIIVTTAATLFVHHQHITTAADAARALEPLLGNLAGVVFALGLLATGVLAVPMFAITIGFVVAEVFKWPAGLSLSFGQAKSFYLTMIVAFLSGGLAAFIGVDPIVALFDSQILDGLLTPILIVLLFLLVNDRRIMSGTVNPRYYNVMLVISFVVMTVAAVALIIQLV